MYSNERMNRDYKNGKVYSIRNTVDDDIYIGSTCEKYLSKRMVKHKSSAKADGRDRNMLLYQKMNELGIENVYIELIENYPCKSKDQLRAREQHYIREMATLNKRVEGRTLEEWQEDSKGYMKEWKKQYSKERKDEIKEKVKKYREENPDKTKEKSKAYHEKNEEQIKERINQYRKDNVDLIKQRRKVNYQRNKEKVKAEYQEY